jgi:hypothetical protein
MSWYLPQNFATSYPIFSRVSNHYRERRIHRFIELMSIRAGTTILDVGGQPYFWKEFPVQARVTCLNLYRGTDEADIPENVSMEVYDGGKFPYSEGSFDVVHSNSVIEHVGDYHRQKQFAAQIMRVGKQYWVQTPNFFFPYEPHAQFPGFQFLPPNLKCTVGRSWKKAGYPPDDLLSIQLLTYLQLQDLFPGAAIFKEKCGLLTKSFCVYKRC